MNDLYKSPIDMMMSKTVHEIQTQQEEHILRAVLNAGINVDKEELIKALQYDRGQYDKGYADGVREFAERLERVISISAAQKPYFDNLVEEMAGDVHGT